MTTRLFFLNILVFFLPEIYLCQNKTYSLSLYYGINETESVVNYNKLDSVYNLIKDNNPAIKIIGHADFLNSDQYNLSLSQTRADRVKTHLLQKSGGKKFNIIECEGQGENASRDNQSPLGEPAQRRVDIFISLENTDKSIQSENLKSEQPAVSKNKPINVKELKTGEAMAIEGLTFIPGRHVAVKASMAVLDNLAKTLKQNPGVKIEIQGHVCCLSEEEDGFDFDTYDRQLSVNRAKAVYEYLIKSGIDKSRLSYKGFGHKNPKIDPETSPEDEQQNRRVEIMVTER